MLRRLLDLGLDPDERIQLGDHLLKSTPLGWACRWGRTEMVELLLARGADPVEADAERWATPRAWAEKMRRPDIVELPRCRRRLAAPACAGRGRDPRAR